jgi:hypothetical protein
MVSPAAVRASVRTLPLLRSSRVVPARSEVPRPQLERAAPDSRMTSSAAPVTAAEAAQGLQWGGRALERGEGCRRGARSCHRFRIDREPLPSTSSARDVREARAELCAESLEQFGSYIELIKDEPSRSDAVRAVLADWSGRDPAKLIEVGHSQFRGGTLNEILVSAIAGMINAGDLAGAVLQTERLPRFATTCVCAGVLRGCPCARESRCHFAVGQ